jgi:8-oxo-dGTP pyrophosphatase MutT (NUDIX family)
MSDDFYPTENYLTMKRWLSILDLIYVFTATPDESLKREFTNLLTDKTGSIMQIPILKSYKDSIEKCIKKYGSLFKNIESFDTTDFGLNEVNYKITKRTLEILKDNISEKIGFINRDNVSDISEVLINSSSISALKSPLNYGYRSDVEVSDSLQPVPILVVTNKERTKVLSFQKKSKSQTSETSPEANKLLIYLGGHVRQEDQIESSQNDALTVSRFALHREVKEEIGIDFYPPSDSELFCVWDKSTDRSIKHLGICYLLEEDLETLKIKLDKNEFKESVIVEVDKLDDFINEYRKKKKAKLELESWSKLILKNVFNRSLQGELPLN